MRKGSLQKGNHQKGSQGLRYFGLLAATFFCGGIICSGMALACTDFKITAQDGTVLITRSMEFAEDLKSNLRNSARGKEFKNTTTDGKSILSWKAKHGYVFVDGLNQPMVVDGMNEKGLSFGYLYLPGDTKYQSFTENKADKSLPYYLLGDWVLGNFETIEEVKNALATIAVVEQHIPGGPSVTFPLHASIYDATGKGIVVEFIDGEMEISDNEIGVLTNSPTYDWQLTNLNNYVNLSPYTPNPIVIDGITYSATGQGAGMKGLPGDVSPPSRFVKTNFMTKSALPVEQAKDALNLAEHIINNVDIPKGLVRAKSIAIDQANQTNQTSQANQTSQINPTDKIELTQWVIFKDLKNKILYFRTYNNMTLRFIAMDKLDFSEKSPSLIMPLAGEPYAMDITTEFTSEKNQKSDPIQIASPSASATATATATAADIKSSTQTQDKGASKTK